MTNPHVHRKNRALAMVLALFALAVASSVFIWQFMHVSNAPIVQESTPYGR
jgi:hypothetical protein